MLQRAERFLELWKPTEQEVPARLAADLPELMRLARDQLHPGKMAHTVMTVREKCAQFKAANEVQMEAFMKETIEVLIKYPGDIVEYACQQVVETHVYPNLPTTALFVRFAAPELARRKLLLLRLETAKLKIGHRVIRPAQPGEALTEEDQVKLQQIQSRIARADERGRPVATPKKPAHARPPAVTAAVIAEASARQLVEEDSPAVQEMLRQMGIAV